MTPAGLPHILSLLLEQRRALVAQLDAVDQAIAALAPAHEVSVTTDTAADLAPLPSPTAPAAEVVPTRIPRRRTLSDAHKEALTAGARKARASKEAARGLAREALDDSFVPAVGKSGEPPPPRLVKRPRH